MIFCVVTLLKKCLNFARLIFMKKRLCFLMVTIGLVLLNPAGFALFAQSPRTIEVGPHIGATTYAGDLNVWRNMGQWEWKGLKQFSYDYGAVVRYNYDPRWSFRVDYSHLKLRAGDAAAAWRPQSLLTPYTRGKSPKPIWPHSTCGRFPGFWPSAGWAVSCRAR